MYCNKATSDFEGSEYCTGYTAEGSEYCVEYTALHTQLELHRPHKAVCDVTDLLCCDWTGEKGSSDCFIHDRDVDWLRQSDGDVLIIDVCVFHGSCLQGCVTSDLCVHTVVVAEVTQPSLGVGYELGRAVDMKKKIFCLFRPSSGRCEDTSHLCTSCLSPDENNKIIRSLPVCQTGGQ